MQKFRLLAIGILCLFATGAEAQWIERTPSQADSRFTISYRHRYSTMSDYETVQFFVQNHTSRELRAVIEVTTSYTCNRSGTYKLGINQVVYLEPNGRFTPDDDWVHSQETTKKECIRKIGNDQYTTLSSVTYRILSVTDLTAEKEKAAAEKKKKEEEAKLAAEQKKKEAEEKKKAEEARRKADEEARLKKAEADKKAQAEAQKKKEAEQAQKEAAAKTSAAASSGESESTSPESDSKAAAAAKKEQERQEYEASQAAARQAAQEQEEARKREEERQRQERQQAYDQWKAQKQEERSQMEAASVAASFSILTMAGGWIYSEKMGDVNPEFIYRDDVRKTQFYTGIDFGYSATVFPMIFKSNYSTMINGEYYDEYSLEKVGAFTINLDVKLKMGAENEQYGGYAYFHPKVGFSPIFDAFNFSPLVVGGKAYGGLKWVKGYMDYSIGGRKFTKTDLDPEEYGDGKSAHNFRRLQFGVQFTTKPDADYKRSHISLGMIAEVMKPKFLTEWSYADPVTNSIRTGKTSAIRGYAFEWKKDHHFSWYINAFPGFIYGGETNNSGSPSSDFKDKTTGLFLEVGFLRSVDWWMN